METAMFVIATVRGILHSVQTWLQYRDSQRALAAREAAFKEASESEEVRDAAQTLSGIISQQTLDLLRKRVKECDQKFIRMLTSGEYFEEDLLDASRNKVPACVCRNLIMIMELAGHLPDRQLEKAWQYFKCKDRQDSLFSTSVKGGGAASPLSQKLGA